jgi:hypothetical protein
MIVVDIREFYVFTSKLAALDKINNCTKGKINIIGNIALFLKICLNSFCMMNSMVLMFCFLALIEVEILLSRFLTS